MRLVEEPLLDAMLRAQHDPDPVRAYRDYPFVMPTHHRASAAGAVRIGLDLHAPIAALGDWLRLLSRNVVPQAVPAVSCCA